MAGDIRAGCHHDDSVLAQYVDLRIPDGFTRLDRLDENIVGLVGVVLDQEAEIGHEDQPAIAQDVVTILNVPRIALVLLRAGRCDAGGNRHDTSIGPVKAAVRAGLVEAAVLQPRDERGG